MSVAETLETVPMLVGGRWEESRSERFGAVFNPSTGREIARVPLGTAEDVDRAVAAAATALPAWAETPAVERARVLFRFRERLVDQAEELARLVTREHGKTLGESRASVQRGIEMVEFACGVPSLLMGQSLPNIARDVDCETVRHPVGVCAGITPFNFPVMVPLWMIPVALACGNTFVLEALGKGAPLGRPARRAADGLWPAGGGPEHRPRRQGMRRRPARPPPGRGDLVRRLDAGGAAHLRDGHPERQTSSGGGRGQELPDRHARCRHRPGRPRDPGVGLRLRGGAVHGREPGHADRRASPTPSSTGSGTWPAR